MPQPTNQLAQPVINLQFSSSVPAYQKFLLLFSLWEFAKANPPLLAEYFHPSIRRPQRLLPIHFNYHGKYTEHTRFSTLPVPIQRHNNSLYSRQRWLFLLFFTIHFYFFYKLVVVGGNDEDLQIPFISHNVRNERIQFAIFDCKHQQCVVVV